MKAVAFLATSLKVQLPRTSQVFVGSPPLRYFSTITKRSALTMKEAVVHPSLNVEIRDVPTPKPGADEVLIKVIVSGSNPKDWKIPQWRNISQNSGDDIAGIVEAIGENVVEFKKGDRVAAFHQMMSEHGSFAECSIAHAATTFHLPQNTSFEEGATIPLAGMTAAVGLYLRLGLPEPWRPATKRIPLIVYGASTAVGAFAIKLAILSNIHPIIGVAGRGQAFAEDLINKEKGDAIVDYRKGDDVVVSEIKEALAKAGASTVEFAFDAVSDHNSYRNCSQVLSKQGSKLTLVLPATKKEDIPDYVEKSQTMVGCVHSDDNERSTEAQGGIKTSSRDFGFVFYRFFARALQEGTFSGHPYEVVPGGLGGVEKGLANLKNGVNSATKYVFRIEDTRDAKGNL